MAEVPCVNSTLWEFNRGLHKTDNKLQPCENCVTVLRVFEHNRMCAEELDEELV